MFRHRTPLFALAILLFTAFAAPSAFGVLIAGDVDGSGQIDATDIQLTINAALGITVPYNTNVDFDSSGATTAVDIQLVINGALGLVIDTDGDGLSDAAEANLGTNPDVKDTDGGGVDDGTEVIIDHTNPLNAADDQGVVLPTANFTATPVTGSFPLDVQFTDTSTNGSSTINQWLWGFGDSSTSTLKNPLHTYTQAGTYNVSLTVHSPSGQNSITKNSYITVTQPAQQQVHWVSLQDGYWDDGNNWSTGQVPNSQQLAVVDLPSQNITVTIRNFTQVYNADIKENLTIASGGTLYETGKANLTGTLSFVSGGLLRVNGAGATFTATGTTQLTNPAISVQNGGVASFPTLTSFTYNTNVNPTLLDVSGTGSSLDLSHLTTFAFNDGVASNITAYISVATSGHIDLSALTTVTLGTGHQYEFDVASGGTISADLLQTNAGLRVSTSTGGALTLPGLTSLSNAYILGSGSTTVPNATTADHIGISLSGNGSLTADNLTSITNANGTITLTGASAMSLPKVTTMSDSSVTLQNTASLTLPLLTTMSSATNHTLSVSNTATLDLAALTHTTNIVLSATNAGHISLPALTTYTWNYNVNPTAIYADGTGSQVTLPVLTNLTFNQGGVANITLYIEGSNNGNVTLASLQDVTLGTNHSYNLWEQTGGTVVANLLRTNSGLGITVNANCSMTLPGLTSLTNTHISNAGTLNLPNVTTASNAWMSITGGTLVAPLLASFSASNTTFDVNGTAVVSLPGLTTLTDTSLRVQNTASFSAPGLTSISSSTSNTITVSNTATLAINNVTHLTNIALSTTSGGQLTLPALTTYTWTYNVNPTAIQSDGTGSVISLPVLTSFTFNQGAPANITLYIEGSNNGNVSIPALQDVTLGTNHALNLWLQAGGTISANLLRTNSGLGVTVNTGTSLSLPGLTSLTNSRISSAGTLTLPNVTTANNTWVSITGGSMVAPLLASITAANTTVDVNGTATVTLPSLTTLTDTSVRVQNTATFSAPALTSVSSATNHTITVSNAATLGFGSVTHLTNMVLNANNAGQLTLPALTTYTWTYNVNPTAIQADGTGSVISLPVLTNFTFNQGAAANITLYIEGSNNGNVSLPALQDVTLGANHSYNLWLQTGGTITANLLRANSGLGVTVNTGTSLTLPGLTSLTNSRISSAGTFTVPNVTAAANTFMSITGGSVVAPLLASITNANTTIDVNGSAVVSLPSLTTLADSSVRVQNTAVFAAPALTSITSTTGATISVTNSGAFTANLVTGLTNVSLYAYNGGNITLPGVTSMTWNINANPTPIWATGAGSQITLAALTQVTFNAGAPANITFYEQASAGGHVNTAALTTVNLGTNHHMVINADGAGSQVTITALNPLPANVTATGTSGGTIL